MAIDYKLVCVGGGCKTRELFCTLCTCQSSLVHQPNNELCEHFCAENVDDINWKCYPHPIITVLSLSIRKTLIRAGMAPLGEHVREITMCYSCLFFPVFWRQNVSKSMRKKFFLTCQNGTLINFLLVNSTSLVLEYIAPEAIWLS